MDSKLPKIQIELCKEHTGAGRIQCFLWLHYGLRSNFRMAERFQRPVTSISFWLWIRTFLSFNDGNAQGLAEHNMDAITALRPLMGTVSRQKEYASWPGSPDFRLSSAQCGKMDESQRQSWPHLLKELAHCTSPVVLMSHPWIMACEPTTWHFCKSALGKPSAASTTLR